jgi:hypothetical protein
MESTVLEVSPNGVVSSAETETPATPAKAPVNIWDRAVCLVLNIGCIGNSKKVRKGEVVVKSATGEKDPENEAIRNSKELMVSPELEAVKKKHNQIRGWITENSVPSMLKAGSYMVAIGLVADVHRKLQNFRDELKPLVTDLRSAYQQRKEEGMARLGDLGREEDYLTDEQLAEKFVFEWQWIAFSTPKKLASVDPAFFEQAKAEHAEHWKQATDQMQLVMRQAMKGLVDHMVDRLTPEEDGKKKTFHATAVDNLAKFLGEFEMKNITDDRQLKELVEKTQSLLAGVDVKKLRKDEDFRTEFRNGFEEVQNRLDALVVNRGTRVISFDEEE